jgi:hypothetical protein
MELDSPGTLHGPPKLWTEHASGLDAQGTRSAQPGAFWDTLEPVARLQENTH